MAELENVKVPVLTRIVVVHFGDLAPTLAAIRLWATWVPVVVVANDGTARPGLPQNVEWIVAPGNLGYGAAFNLAVDRCPADAYILLNTDVEMSRALFDRMVSRLRAEPHRAIVAPTLVFPDGHFQSAAGSVEGIGRHPRVRSVRHPEEEECEWVTGAAMAIDGEFAKQLPFAEGYFLGGEDVDLCIRARRHGWRVVCLAGEPAVHDRAHVIGGMWAYYTPRNQVWLARGCYGSWSGLAAWLFFLRRIPRTLAGDVMKRRSLSSVRLHVRGLVDALRPVPVYPLPGEPRPMRGPR